MPLSFFQILHRHFFCKPHTVFRPVEPIAIVIHFLCFYQIKNRFSVTLSHLFRRLPVLGQMNIQSCSRVQSLLIDRSDILLAGTMPERFRRLHLFQFHIDRDRMSLICPNLCFIFIKSKSLFVICPYNFFQYFSVKFIFILFSFGKFITLYYHNQIYCTINDPTYLYQFLYK